jgi:hypothetical protein
MNEMPEDPGVDDASVARVATIVEQRATPEFVAVLKAAGTQFRRSGFEASLAAYLRAEHRLVDEWATWSADQRWTPSAYLDGTEVGWYDAGYRNVRHHADSAEAAADTAPIATSSS